MTYEQKEGISWCYGLAIVASTIALFANTIATDNGGSDDEDHQGNLPAQVVQITPDEYILRAASSLRPEDICRGDGGKSDGVTIEASIPVPELNNATFVECVVDQRWGVNQHPSPNFGESMILTVTHPAWYIPTGGLLGIITLFAGGFGISGRRRNRKRVSIDLEQKRRELRASYAKGEIDDLTFQTAMDRLYAEGVKPARDD